MGDNSHDASGQTTAARESDLFIACRELDVTTEQFFDVAELFVDVLIHSSGATRDLVTSAVTTLARVYLQATDGTDEAAAVPL